MSISDRRESEFDCCFDPGAQGSTATLPFHELDDGAFNAHIGINKARAKPKMRGNYIAGYILAQHRIQAKKYQPRWRNLEGIFTLPMELLIEILEKLHPIDLYHIILTTRELRELLLSKSASAIWKSSFEAYPEIPFYSAGVSAPKWASLLFGPGTCDECGRENTLPDLIHYTRKCDEGCSDWILKDKRWLYNMCLPISENYYAAIRRHIWSIARKTYITDMKNQTFSPGYSKKDVVELAFTMARYMENISAEIPGAKTAYDIFIQETCYAQRTGVERMKSWVSQIMDKSVAAFDASIKKYVYSTKKILAKRGHDPRDIASLSIYEEGIKRRWGVCSEPVLTKKSAWRSVATFDEKVANEKKYRLSREHEERVKARRNHLNEFYLLTAKTHMNPKVAPFLPIPTILQKVPIFQDYLHNKTETVDMTVLLPDAEGLIQRFVTSVIHDKKQYFVKIMADAGAAAITDGHESVDDILELATALFQCCDAHGRVFIGWDEVGVYTNSPSKETQRRMSSRYYYLRGDLPLSLKFACNIYGGNTLVATEYGVDLNCRFKFDTSAWDTLKKIAELLGVDWRTVPAKVLDALGKRFVCKICSFTYKPNGASGLEAMDWRECINHRRLVSSHFYYKKRCRSGTPSFTLLSDEMTRIVRRVELMYPKPTDLAWACCHCTEFFINRVTRAAAIAHTWTKHGISKPILDHDFFYHRTESSLEPEQVRPIVIVRLEADANHRCLKCKGERSLRLRFKRDLMNHLVYQHKMDLHEIIEGEHWVKVKLFEGEGWFEEGLRRNKS